MSSIVAVQAKGLIKRSICEQVQLLKDHIDGEPLDCEFIERHALHLLQLVETIRVYGDAPRHAEGEIAVVEATQCRYTTDWLA